MLGKHLRINHTPFFLISREAFKKYPISREIGLKTLPFQVFLGGNLPETNGQNTPFPEKMGIRMRPPYTFEWRGGGGCGE